jgi:hypothetical protein
VAAVSKAQTRNTMSLFPGLVSTKMKSTYGVVVGKEQVVALAGARSILAVTSSPTTLEGNRPTFSIGNEPHLWRDNNNGYEMRSVMARNTAKSPNAASRICWITNAYNPSENSVGQMNREAWEEMEGDGDHWVLYDSLEAPEDARLVPREIPVVLEATRGDATWLDIEGLTKEILDPRNPPSTSRRFYYNQVTADSETWVDPKAVDATIEPQVHEWRRDPDIESDSLRVGWALVDPREPVVVFFDGGKSDDHTAMSGCRVSDGYTFALGYWARPRTLDPKAEWRAPRHEVDKRMTEVMQRFNVIALWADPSHAKDDEDDIPYWVETLNQWHRRWKDRLLPHWAVKTGDRQHSVNWDMTNPLHQSMFVPAAEEFVRAMEEGEFFHDGHPVFVRYMKNARRLPTKWGTSLWKGARGSARKIDGAVTHVGAHMLRNLVLNKGLESKEPGKAWGSWGTW